MVRLLQGVSSSDTTITQRLIVPRCTEIDGSYIEYIPLPQVVTVLYSKRHQKKRVHPRVCCH